MSYIQYVNPLMGTDSVHEFSNGNTLPLAAFPFGANHYSPDTRGGTSFYFNSRDYRTKGIRLTHTMSPWLGDYNYLTMNAVIDDGRILRVSADKEPESTYNRDKAVFTPASINMHLNFFNTDIMLSPTPHGGIFRAIWNFENKTNFFTLSPGPGKAEYKIDYENGILTGSSKTLPNRDNIPGDFRLYFVFRFDLPIVSEKTVITDTKAAIAFTGKPCTLNVSFATSFISPEQAMFNLDSEIGGASLEDIRESAEKVWENYLSKIEITAPQERLRTFYSCFYRCFLFPRAFHEKCPDGRIRHFSPLNGQVCDGPFYTDNCFWDTYKTSFPLFSVIDSALYREMCEGFVNFYKESGWLPRCVSPAAVNCMPGTAIDAVFADAAVKKIVTDSDMLDIMLKALEKHAENVAPDPAMGRDGIADFNSLGYVSNKYVESVNKTLDYAYGNYCIAKVAEAAGKPDKAEKYYGSALNYRNLFDNDTGFFRAKDENGCMRSDFSDIDWGGDYTEGSAWQNTFAVYHDLLGYAGLLGGRDKFLDKVNKLFSTPPDYRTFGYNCEIHEMTEMAAYPQFGQCALSNQPSFHIPYLFSCMGNRDLSAYWVRKAVNELFGATPDGFPGDEDTGSMGAWYVFSCLGFYPVCPGSDEYVVASPSVSKAVIHLESGNDFIIIGAEFSEDKLYASEITVNGKRLENTFINHNDIKNGGTLLFNMSGVPSEQKYTDTQLPYSLSRKLS